MTPTVTLSDFLLARIAEDEAVANAAASDVGSSAWDAYYAECGTDWLDVYPDEGQNDADSYVGRVSHIARHDPARVLAECEAKGRIVEGFKFEDSDESAVDAWMGEDARPPAAIHNLIYVAKCLALPYADHPDYREEWRP